MLNEHGEDAKLLAGGHSLLPAMKLRMNRPTMLIDISKAGLTGISDLGDKIQIGACTTHAELETDKIIQHNLPMMAKAASKIGDPQVRNRGTIGGSLAHADPAADWPGVVLALGATIHVAGPDGERAIAADDFFISIFTTALKEGEIITAIDIPKMKQKASAAYVKFEQPASRYAIVGCAVNAEMNGPMCADIRIAFNGVSGAAFRDTALEEKLKGQKLDEESVNAACKEAAEGRHIMSDHFASDTYRKHLAGVIAERAIHEVL